MTPLQIKFIRFLKENNAYYVFNQNLWYIKLLNIIQYTNQINKDLYIIEAFNWAATEQGHDFWDNLDEKWYDYE